MHFFFPARRALLLNVAFSATLFSFCGGCHAQSVPPQSTSQSSTPAATQTVTTARRVHFKVVKSFPHDPNAFTQGLLWHDSALYESTGLEGKSSLRRVDLTSGKVLQSRRDPNDVFAEGLALAGERLIQISWQNHRAFAYDEKTFEPLGEWTYDGEGWGLTTDGKNLIMSDGSEFLTWRDPKTFEAQKRVAVTYNGAPLKELNELEWIDGEVWANVWQTDIIARIDPQTGVVKEYLDCSSLLGSARRGGEDVLNGIAYDASQKRIFITGKLWPRLFEIALQN